MYPTSTPLPCAIVLLLVFCVGLSIKAPLRYKIKLFPPQHHNLISSIGWIMFAHKVLTLPLMSVKHELHALTPSWEAEV